MTEPHHLHTRSEHRRRKARLLLAMIIVTTGIADVLLWAFTKDPRTPQPGLCGLVVASLIGTLLLVIALLQRKGWARLILIGFNWLLVAIFGWSMLMQLDMPDQLTPIFLACGVGALAILTFNNVVLIRSRSITRFARPASAGET